MDKNREFGFLIDDRANPAERAALEQIFTGYAGGAFAAWRDLTLSLDGVEFVPMTVTHDAENWRVEVPGMVDGLGGPFRKYMVPEGDTCRIYNAPRPGGRARLPHGRPGQAQRRYRRFRPQLGLVAALFQAHRLRPARTEGVQLAPAAERPMRSDPGPADALAAPRSHHRCRPAAARRRAGLGFHRASGEPDGRDGSRHVAGHEHVDERHGAVMDTAVDALLLFVMWSAMMAAMMVPGASPMVSAFATINRRRRQRSAPYVPTAVFLLGYLDRLGRLFRHGHGVTMGTADDRPAHHHDAVGVVLLVGRAVSWPPASTSSARSRKCASPIAARPTASF